MEIDGHDRRKPKLTSQTSVLTKRGRHNHHSESSSDSLVGLTVDAVILKSQELNNKQIKPPKSTLTLLDIISNDESGSAYRGLAALNGIKTKKSNKKSIKQRLKFHRPTTSSSSSSSWSSSSVSHPVPTSDLPRNNGKINHISNPILIHRTSLPRSLSSRSVPVISDDNSETSDLTTTTTTPDEDVRESLENEPSGVILEDKMEVESEEDEIQEKEKKNAVSLEEPLGNDDVDEDENEENGLESLIPRPTVEVPLTTNTVSLMALLEESGRRPDEEEEEEDENEQDDEDENGGEEYECTVCMVKHRGFAFIPCWHSICKLCSKQLWDSRGNCPLCTSYIFEILDVF